MNTKTTTPNNVSDHWYAIDAPMEPLSPDWLVEGLLERGGLLLLTGATADIRTAVAIDLMLVLSGADGEWLTLPTRRCKVKYVKKHDRDVAVTWRHVTNWRLSDADAPNGTGFDAINADSDVLLPNLAEHADVIVIDDLATWAHGDQREGAAALAHFAEFNHVAVVLLADEPLDGFDYLHIHRDDFRAHKHEAVLEFCRDDEACRIDVGLRMDDIEFFLEATDDEAPY
jgi:hypothetical protein